MKGKVFVLLLILTMPFSVKGLDCSYKEQARLKKIASNVTTSYDYSYNADGTVKFNVTLTNLNSEIYIKDVNYDGVYYYNGTSEVNIDGYQPGADIKYTIYATKENCVRTLLATKYVKLPFYNYYHDSDICKGKTYSICDKWQRVTISSSEFEARIKELDNIKPKEEEVTTKEMTIFDYISSFVFEYYLYIILGIIGLSFGIEYYIKRKNDFDL